MYDIRCLEGGSSVSGVAKSVGVCKRGICPPPPPGPSKKLIFLGPFRENSGKIRLYLYNFRRGRFDGPLGLSCGPGLAIDPHP